MTNREDDVDQWERALDYSNKKMMNADILQGQATLAVAEAIHRMAAALERLAADQQRTR